MQKSFFTNEDENTLENKINHLLENDKNIEFLDFLIGYFRITGFDKIVDKLKPEIKMIRILIGINTDKNTYDASELIKKFANEQIKQYNETPILETDYHNFVSMKQLIEDKKIEIKISPDKNVHSKLYILRSDVKLNHSGDGDKYFGSGIIGSSNLTYNGLENNIEMNVEINTTDMNEAVKVFEELWKKAVSLEPEDIDSHIIKFIKKPKSVESENITQENLTPYQLYIKLLIEHFGTKIDFINDDNIFVPQGYKKLSYQVDAVNDGIYKLEKHNGFFLSDVVGLGKTVVIAMMIKKLEATFKKGVLVVIPPAIRNQWDDTFKEFEIGNYHIISLASLYKIDANRYELVIVDESHKFKNLKSKRYEELSKICKGKKVILLSATPQNNSPKDLHSQLNLFQNMKKSTLANCENLDKFFNNLEPQYKFIINNTPIDKSALKALSITLRDTVVRDIMIRRTRTDIQKHTMYSDDFKSQGLTIPEVKKLNEHTYKMDKELSEKFEETAKILIKELAYTRFNAFAYLTPEAREIYYPKESDNIFQFNPLAGLMKISLVKRFESSFEAFNISIKRHLLKYDEFIKRFNEDTIYLGDKASDLLDYNEEEDGDYDTFAQNLLVKGKTKLLNKKCFGKIIGQGKESIVVPDDGAEFLEHLIRDKKIFEKLVQKWDGNTKDPKLDKFIEEINNQKLSENRDKKIVVFTESSDTLYYLSKNLPNKEKILFITGENRDINKTIIKENFDANYDKKKQKNIYNIIVTTDTLSEGINLHRSNIIYNYDIPWNATKLIQRIGRVNRIGTTAQYINVHNLKPSANIDLLIGLNQKAYVKLQSSHIAYGEDNKIYTEDEEVSTVKLFNEYQKTSIQDRDEELDFLEELREFKRKYLDTFNLLSNLPQDLKICRVGQSQESYIVLDIDNNKNYFCVDDTNIKSINFLDIAKAMKSDVDEVAIKTDDTLLSNHTKRVIEYCQDNFDKENKIKAEGKLTKGVEQKTIVFIKRCIKKKLLDKEQFKIIKNGIVSGDIDIITANEILQLEQSPDANIKDGINAILTKINDNPIDDLITKKQVFTILLTHTLMEK